MAKKAAKKMIPSIEIPSAKTGEQFATRKELHLVRDELKSDIRSLELKIDGHFNGIESRFNGIESRFNGIESRFNGIESRLEKMQAEQFRMYALMEEQNSNNRIVLEGLQGLWQRQERIEQAQK